MLLYAITNRRLLPGDDSARRQHLVRLAAAARYRIARATYTQSWLEAHNGNAVVPARGTVGGYWTQHVPFMTFFMESLPETAQAEILKAAQKNAPLRHELNQGAAAYSWLKAGGYL